MRASTFMETLRFFPGKDLAQSQVDLVLTSCWVPDEYKGAKGVTIAPPVSTPPRGQVYTLDLRQA